VADVSSWLKERVALVKENASLKEALTSMEYVRTLERFHTLDGLKDGFCPACGAAVNIIDNGYGTGVKIESRWG